jgi:hypothetical protein
MFFLRQEWRDAEDGIEVVVLHWTTTPPEQQPNWRRAHHTTVMIPQTATTPVTRSCSMWVTPPFSPYQLFRVESLENLRFHLHFFHEVIQRGRLWSTEARRQEIRALSVTHRDDSGEYTQAFLYYSFDNFMHGNRIPMSLEGLPIRNQQSLVFPDRRSSAREYRAWARRDRLVARLPLPHVFRGRIWGPVNTRALYMVYFQRQGVYNPFSEGGFWLLRNGSPWEAQF